MLLLHKTQFTENKSYPFITLKYGKPFRNTNTHTTIFYVFRDKSKNKLNGQNILNVKKHSLYSGDANPVLKCNTSCLKFLFSQASTK